MMANWRKSSRSQGSDHCVEVRFTEDTVFIRDSKYLRDPANAPAAQPIIAIPAKDWPAFLDAATARSADLPHECPAIEYRRDGNVTLHGADGITLTYTAAEWHAFTAGIHIGEFAAA